MQGNLQWIIPLIALAVWIITHLLKAGSEQQQKQRRQQQQGGAAPARRPAGDIDRFLEEIQRRRKKPPAESAPPPPVVRETPSRPVKPPPMPRRVERPPVSRSRPPEIPRQPRQVVQPPVELVVLEEVKEVAQAPGIAEANVAPSERAAYKAPTVSPVKTPTEAARTLAEILRTRDGLKTAVLLQEVMGPPRCKRRRTT
jgi:hypothetical protein